MFSSRMIETIALNTNLTLFVSVACVGQHTRAVGAREVREPSRLAGDHRRGMHVAGQTPGLHLFEKELL